MNDVAFIREKLYSNQEADLDYCPECQSKDIIIDQARGESVCVFCGLVISHHIIDTGREGRRAFSLDEKSKRDQTGSPVSTLLPDLGLTTVIETSSNLSQRMRRIIKWNTRMSWANRNMLIAATEIKRIGSLLNLPLRVKEYAAKIYRQAFKLKLLRGRSINSLQPSL
jgi:transcription initiation factor TFIIB